MNTEIKMELGVSGRKKDISLCHIFFPSFERILFIYYWMLNAAAISSEVSTHFPIS
jgi:hypothetical protein